MKFLKTAFSFLWGLLKKIFIPTPSYLFTQIFLSILILRLFIWQNKPLLRYRSLNNMENSMSVDTLIVTESEFIGNGDGVGRFYINGYLKNDNKPKKGIDYSAINGEDEFMIVQKAIDSVFLNGKKTPIVPVLKHKLYMSNHIYPIKDKEYLKRERSGLLGEIIIFYFTVPFHFFLRIILFTIKFIKNAK